MWKLVKVKRLEGSYILYYKGGLVESIEIWYDPDMMKKIKSDQDIKQIMLYRMADEL